MERLSLAPPMVSSFEALLLLNAANTEHPATGYALTGDTAGGVRRARLAAYIRAGFLVEHAGRHPLYSITPAGRELAALLQRLEIAREDR